MAGVLCQPFFLSFVSEEMGAKMIIKELSV